MPILCVSMTNFHTGDVFRQEAAISVSFLSFSPSALGASSQSVQELYPETELESQISLVKCQNKGRQKILESNW